MDHSASGAYNAGVNATGRQQPSDEEEYVFDRPDVQIVFAVLYTLVFCSCFFGNLLVILVVSLHRRLRSTTNLFLANLAVADLCVAVFCVYQNFYIYLISSWVLGDFLCKMYQFAHSLSYTASIFILVVICTERYFGIIHPITCKQILTPTRLRMTMALVWCLSAAYSAPRFRIMKTITNSWGDGVTETICVPDRQEYDSEAFDICNFILLYAIPLLLMSALYARIALGLWATTTTKKRARRRRRPRRRPPRATLSNDEAAHTDVDATPPAGNCGFVCEGGGREQVVMMESSPGGTANNNNSSSRGGSAWCVARKLRSLRRREGQLVMASCAADGAPPRAVLRARRGVVRMLVVVVMAFAVCHLPLHARKMWQYWSPTYRGDSRLSSLLTPLTFLISYANSGINPLLYAFMSRNFRRGMWEVLRCSGSGPGGRRGAGSTAAGPSSAADQGQWASTTNKVPGDSLRRNGSSIRMPERVGGGGATAPGDGPCPVTTSP